MFHRIFTFIIEAVFWFLGFLSLVLFCTLIGIALKFYYNFTFEIIIYFASFGAFAGIFLAEYIRRKYGSSAFWGSISATPDIAPSPLDEEKIEK